MSETAADKKADKKLVPETFSNPVLFYNIVLKLEYEETNDSISMPGCHIVPCH